MLYFFTQEKVDIILVGSSVYTVSSGQHVPGGDQRSPTQTLTIGGTAGAEAEDNIPGVLMGASLTAAGDPRWSVDLATFTFHSGTCCGRW